MLPVDVDRAPTTSLDNLFKSLTTLIVKQTKNPTKHQNLKPPPLPKLTFFRLKSSPLVLSKQALKKACSLLIDPFQALKGHSRVSLESSLL